MATEAVDICNLALYRIGADAITATQLTTPDNEASRVCSEFYAQTRDEVLVMTRFGWNCAKKRIEIAADNSEPVFDYDYKFRLPEDCLRVLYPSNSLCQPIIIDWERRGDYLLLNDDECYLVYIHQLTDVRKMGPLLIKAISLQLAFSICIRLKQSSEMKNDIRKDLAVVLMLAEGVEASEKYAADPGSTRRTNKTLWVDVQ